MAGQQLRSIQGHGHRRDDIRRYRLCALLQPSNGLPTVTDATTKLPLCNFAILPSQANLFLWSQFHIQDPFLSFSRIWITDYGIS